MTQSPANEAEPRVDLVGAFMANIAARGHARDPRYERAAKQFLQRWPNPADWAHEPLSIRLRTKGRALSFVTFLMMNGDLHPGYDYLLERKMIGIWRELRVSPLYGDLERFMRAADQLGFATKRVRSWTGLVAARLLIQCDGPLDSLTGDDIDKFRDALRDRERRTGRAEQHYRRHLFGTRSVLYHLGILKEPPLAHPPHPKRTFAERFTTMGVPTWLIPSFVAYLEAMRASREPSTVSRATTVLGYFGQHLGQTDPQLSSLTELDRQRHIETYLAAVADAKRLVDGRPISVMERCDRIATVHRFLADIAEWGWAEAPRRRLIFPRDTPRRPLPLPRYLPPEADARLSDGLRKSQFALAANALLLQRGTGLRIGELVDLELDCVHEIPGQGAWLKVPLGKLKTERMVPLDDETLAIVDRIVELRSPVRLCHIRGTARWSSSC